MLGIRRTETPKATIIKIGSSGDVPYVVAVVRFCRYGQPVSVWQDLEKWLFRHILLWALQHCSRLPPEHVMPEARELEILSITVSEIYTLLLLIPF